MNQSVYPRQDEGPDAPAEDSGPVADQKDVCTGTNSRDGVVLACDVPDLVTLAKRADRVIRMGPKVGDLVAAGVLLFRIHPGATRLSTDALRQPVSVGDERTLETSHRENASIRNNLNQVNLEDDRDLRECYVGLREGITAAPEELPRDVDRHLIRKGT